jgi:selT/selW/selH-like putative selenoprotein
LEAALKSQKPDLAIELIQGDRGIFDVHADGRLIFSKKTAGHFPSVKEILRLI